MRGAGVHRHSSHGLPGGSNIEALVTQAPRMRTPATEADYG
jgi:hypothetical protein